MSCRVKFVCSVHLARGISCISRDETCPVGQGARVDPFVDDADVVAESDQTVSVF
jgi:hypothetical protein